MEEYFKRFPYDLMHNGDNYGIIVDFFEGILAGDDFIKILTYMSEDLGYGGYALGYCFASMCDEEDIENGDYFEDGVMFYLNEDDVIVDYETFYHCLKLACNIYLEKHPEDEESVKEKLSIIRKRYNIKV